jgi:hypothetical protein
MVRVETVVNLSAVREAAWMRIAHAGAQLMNWFSMASERHRDWWNDGEGLGILRFGARGLMDGPGGRSLNQARIVPKGSRVCEGEGS